MKAMVIYDSLHGNTGKIARAVSAGLGDAIGDPACVATLQVGDARPDQFAGVDILLVGAPTHGCRPSPPAREFLSRIPNGALTGVKVGAFDTRFDMDKMESLRMIGKVLNAIGYAAPRIASTLEKKGGTMVAPPEGFFVEDTEGPLEDGELERAAQWARELKSLLEG